MLTWDYNYFPSLYGGEYLYDNIGVNPLTFVPDARRAAAHAAAGWAHGSCRAITCRISGIPVSHPNSNDYSGVRAGHGAVDAAFDVESGSALRPADVFEQGW